MKSSLSHATLVVTAFAAGFVSGILFAPQSGKTTRKRLADEARGQLKVAESQIEAIEEHLADLNERVHETGKDLSGKIRQAANNAVDSYIPDLADGVENWSEGGEDEVVKDLRNMTRKVAVWELGLPGLDQEN